MKQIKNPIYGYIDIEDFCLPLIDAAEFQRLRNINDSHIVSKKWLKQSNFYKGNSK